MELEFFGAAGEVTGSCHILRVGDQQVLLDCGMIQGSRQDVARNHEEFPFDARSIDAVLLSHAHLDHSGRLPLLVRRGFSETIHTHNASQDLADVLLRDAGYLQESDARRKNRRRKDGEEPVMALFTKADVEDTLPFIRGHKYAQWFDVVPGIRARFHDAGHIMGSAIVEIEAADGERKRTIVFSGDLGQYDTPILKDPVGLSHADLVVMESTYGGRKHRSRDETLNELGDIFERARKDRGNVLIPAFSIGRSQEILYHLGKYHKEWRIDRWRVFLDSPMAIEATKIYWDYPHLYDDEATKLSKQMNPMPSLPNLVLSNSSDTSKKINTIRSGAIVIAGSGMCTGGRILHHLKNNLPRKECHVLITGYQANGSLGRRLVNREEEVRIHGKHYRVRAQVSTVGGLSAHGDESDLSRWYGSLAANDNPPPVYLVHGDPDAGRALDDRLNQDHGANVTRPQPGQKIRL